MLGPALSSDKLLVAKLFGADQNCLNLDKKRRESFLRVFFYQKLLALLSWYKCRFFELS